MPSAGGRPPGPTEETRERLLTAAYHLLVTEGSSSLTPVRLHRETGIARTTVYRHWPTPRHIVEQILAGATARHELDQLTGDLAHDLPIAIHTLTFRFEHRPVVEFYRATLGVDEGGEEPSLSQRYIEGLIAPVRDVLAAAVEAGDLAGDADGFTAQLCGPLLLEHLMLGRTVDPARVEMSVRRFLRDEAGISATSASGR